MDETIKPSHSELSLLPDFRIKVVDFAIEMQSADYITRSQNYQDQMSAARHSMEKARGLSGILFNRGRYSAVSQALSLLGQEQVVALAGRHTGQRLSGELPSFEGLEDGYEKAVQGISDTKFTHGVRGIVRMVVANSRSLAEYNLPGSEANTRPDDFMDKQIIDARIKTYMKILEDLGQFDAMREAVKLSAEAALNTQRSFSLRHPSK